MTRTGAPTGPSPGTGGAPLRIAVFVNSLPPMAADGAIQDTRRFGGVQRACWHLTRELAALGHDVWVFAGVAATGATAANAATDPIDASLGAGQWHVRLSPARIQVGQAAAAPGLFRDPGRHLAGRRIDAVLAYMGDQPAPSAARKWARRWRAPLVVSYHGDPVHGFGSPARRLAVRLQESWLNPRVLRAAERIVALSRAAADSSRVLARHPAKLAVIPNGVPEAMEAPGPKARAAARTGQGIASDERVVLFVGSLTPIKGVDVLLDAVARLPADHRLVLVGAGPGAEEYRQQAERLGLAARVRFAGFVPEADKARLMLAADVLAMPSRSEAFPLTLLEAGMAGLPAVASDLPVLAELVEEGRTGRLVPPGDAAALAAALQETLADPAGRRRMGAAARAWAQGFTWPEAARRTAALLAEVAAPGGARKRAPRP